MENFLRQILFHPVTNTLALASVVAIGGLIIFVLRRNKETLELRQSVAKLKTSFDELDEQAKLIVRTDLELNKVQAELDKRLTALNALQKTSRLISTTLDTNEIYQRLDRSLVSELGFEKNLLLMFDENKNLVCRIATGFSKENIGRVSEHLSKEHSLSAILMEGRSLSSLSSPKQKKEKVVQIFGVEHFILSPILSQNGVIGILLTANSSAERPISESDEELMAILSTQIGQSLENALLFEDAYHSRHELESKIQERTKELADALEEVKKISKAKSEFVSAVSHELRTPLTSIKGYASLLMAGKIGDIPCEVKERLEKIDKHSDSLVSLINDLLDISRIESGRVEMKFGEHKVSDIIENVRDLLMPQMKEKNIQFIAEIPKDMSPVRVDRSQMERAFINLIGNAVKFTPAGGKITVKAACQEGMTAFEICDTGIGISEEEITKLFREFYRIENEINQSVKGSGLGLVLVKNIIEAHKGKIWVTSKSNQGTTFHLQIPQTEKKTL